MEPIAISVRGDGEWILIHRCTGCDALHANRTAGDDNPLLLLRVAVRPIAQPPFPLDRLTAMLRRVTAEDPCRVSTVTDSRSSGRGRVRAPKQAMTTAS